MDYLFVVYDNVWFCSCISSEVITSSYDFSSSSTLWSSLLLFAILRSGFLKTVNSPSFVKGLVALSCRQDRGLDPSGSHQLPIAGSDGD